MGVFKIVRFECVKLFADQRVFLPTNFFLKNLIDLNDGAVMINDNHGDIGFSFESVNG